MELLVFMLPLLIGSATVIALFPEYGLRGVGLAFSGCIGAGIGLGLTASTSFWWLALVNRPDGYYLAAECCLAMLLVLAAWWRVSHAGVWKKNARMPFQIENKNEIRWLKYIFILLLLAFAMSFILKAYFERPHGAHDAWAIWNYRARWLFKGESQWAHAFTYLNAADSPDYPLLVTGSVFRMWTLLGGDYVAVPITVAGVLAVGSILMVFAALTVLRAPNQGYLAAMFICMTTQFLNVATYQYGDAPLAFFILCTVVLFSLQDHYPDLSERLLFLAGLTAACAAWTKNEGLLFLVLVIFIRFISRIRRNNGLEVLKQLLYFTLGMSPIFLALIFFKVNFAIANDLVNQTNLMKLGDYLFDVNRYGTVLFGICKKILTFNDHIFILSIVYLVLSGIDRSAFLLKGVKSHLWILVLMLVGYFFSFFISPHNLEWHMGSSLRRLLVQLWPTWVFLCFYCARGPERGLAPQNA